MKKILYILSILSGILFLNSCTDDEKDPGSPVLEVKTKFSSAMFGDSLPFTAIVSDAQVPLSTLKAQLFFDNEKVSETVIRTKTSGEYSGKLYIPFYKYSPNGTATLKIVMQNINFTIREETYDLPLTRPDYPYLTLVAQDGKEYKMNRTGLYQYTATENFPRQVKGHIKTPVISEYGNALTFGSGNNTIELGATKDISFSNWDSGTYDIKFNTFSYEASPFIIAYIINDKSMTKIDDNHYYSDLSLTQGQEINVSGIDDFSNWWIDPSFFNVDNAGKITFRPISGNYRITADFKYGYLNVEPLDASGKPASLNSDGTGTVWIIGKGIGKPSVAANEVGWDDRNALALAPMGNKKFEGVFEGGKIVSATNINFKFFSTKLGWGGEYTNTRLSVVSDIIFVGAGEDPGPGNEKRDPGNLGMLLKKSFQNKALYLFSFDISGGIDHAVLTVTKL